MLRIEKQSISYRLSDIHIHYVNETDSSSHTEKYIYVAHIDYIAHNAQEVHNMKYGYGYDAGYEHVATDQGRR